MEGTELLCLCLLLTRRTSWWHQIWTGKGMRKPQLFICLYCLLLLANCGNPHLTDEDGVFGVNVPVVGTPQELEAKGIRLNDGLNVTTQNSSVETLVDLQNLDSDKTWVMKFEFEKGENFQWSGSNYPGNNGSCRSDIKGAENCQLDIRFFSGTPGYFADNLKITYATSDEPEKIKEISYPLRGERTSSDNEGVPKVTVKTLAGEEKLEFGKSPISALMSSLVVVRNEGAKTVSLSAVIDQKNEFLFHAKDYPGKKGTCGTQLEASKDCFLDISFNSGATGLYQDQLTLTYAILPSGKKQTIHFPLIGEKIPKSTQGPLVSSEVFSNTIDFGEVRVGVEVIKQFEIQNLGETSYGLKDALIQGEDFHFSGDKYPGTKGTCGDIILPGSCLIEIAYRPQEVGSDVGSFKFTTKEGDAVSLIIKGSGAEAPRCESYHEYLAIPERTYPSSGITFPYLRSVSGSSAKLTHLYGQQVNSFVSEIELYTVKDGMVYVTFKLPTVSGVITKMNFGVHVLKVIRDNYKDTESLCLSSKSVRKCSGHQFSLSSWQKLRNPKFWDKFSKPMNERYEQQFASGESKCGPYTCMNLNTEYELSDIFELTSKELADLRKEGRMTLIFSDDTRMLKMPRIEIKTKVSVSCE